MTRLRQSSAALLGQLRGLATPRPKGEEEAATGWKSRLRGLNLLWLGGAVALIVIGLGLALLGVGAPGPQGVTVNIEIPIPPPNKGSAALLAPAPDPTITENTADGPLPMTGVNGQQAWTVYARPFDTKDARPRIALIVTGVGLDQTLSQAALDRLPGAVTFAFDPYATDLAKTVTNARNLGHEALLGLPMEPIDYPRQDPGPLTLLTSLDETQNGARLHKLMGEASGYVGMVAILGGRFESEVPSIVPVLKTLQQRGLMLVDNKAPDQSSVSSLAAQMSLPWAAGNRLIDAEADPAAIDQAFADLEAAAKRGNAAVGVAALSPALLDHLAPWLATLDGKGFALAPASALANRQTAGTAAK